MSYGNVEVELRDENGVMKFKFENDVFNDMFNKGILAMTKKTLKKFTDGSKATAFTFTESTVFSSPLGKLYFWENDYISVKGL